MCRNKNTGKLRFALLGPCHPPTWLTLLAILAGLSVVIGIVLVRRRKS